MYKYICGTSISCYAAGGGYSTYGAMYVRTVASVVMVPLESIGSEMRNRQANMFACTVG
jgi:hypothetical protein